LTNAIREEVLYDQECRVLNCALSDAVSAFTMVESLTPEDFADNRTRKIAQAIHDIVLSGGAISVAGVKRKLKAKRDLECLEQDVAPIKVSTEEMGEYVEFVREESRLRQLEEACLSARAQMGGSLGSEDIAGELMQKLISISMGEKQEAFTPMERLFDETYDEVASRNDGAITGFSTSLKSLDELMGGWQPKKLYIIAGRPGMAKTALAMQSAARLAYYDDVPTAFFSIEMPEREIMRRIMANITGVEYWRIEKKYWAQEHLDCIKKHRDRMISMPFYINDSGSTTLNQMMAKMKGLKIKHGTLGPMFIDYLQLMKIPIPRGGNRDIAIGETTRALKELAKDLAIPVVLLCQVKRAVEEREDKRPTLADLRESGNIEQNADVVICPYRDSYYTKDPTTEKDCEINVPKNRAGRIGRTDVYVDLDYQMFRDIQGEILI